LSGLFCTILLGLIAELWVSELHAELTTDLFMEKYPDIVQSGDIAMIKKRMAELMWHPLPLTLILFSGSIIYGVSGYVTSRIVIAHALRNSLILWVILMVVFFIRVMPTFEQSRSDTIWVILFSLVCSFIIIYFVAFIVHRKGLSH
jgi:hypothetical protein